MAAFAGEVQTRRGANKKAPAKGKGSPEDAVQRTDAPGLLMVLSAFAPTCLIRQGWAAYRRAAVVEHDGCGV
jgi:hypothetical protein